MLNVTITQTPFKNNIHGNASVTAAAKQQNTREYWYRCHTRMVGPQSRIGWWLTVILVKVHGGVFKAVLCSLMGAAFFLVPLVARGHHKNK